MNTRNAASTSLSAALRAELQEHAETMAYRLGHPTAAQIVGEGEQAALLFLRARGPKERAQGLYELNLTSGEERELVRPSELAEERALSAEEQARRERQRIAAAGFVGFSVSNDGQKVLLPYSGELFVFDRGLGKTHRLPGTEGAIDASFTPDGASVVFLRQHNVWQTSLGGGAPRALTQGGTEATPFGEAEFAAQEEFARSRGYFVSADSQFIAIQTTDQREVERLTLSDPARPERAPQLPYYPRAGTHNATVGYFVQDLRSGKRSTVRWDQARFPYVASARWDAHGPFVLYVLDRAQRHGQLLAVQPDGHTKVLLEEHDDAWLNVDPSVPRFFPDGRFAWSSEASGQWQLQLHRADGALERVLLAGEHGYRAVVARRTRGAQPELVVNAGADPAGGTVLAVGPEGGVQPLAARAHTMYDARAAGAAGVLIAESSLTQWPRYRVLRDGAPREVATTFATPAQLPNVSTLRLGPDRAHALVLRPRAAQAGEKLPVIDSAYGGPHVTLVAHHALGLARAQWMADAAHALVVILDAPGTPRRGRDYERPLWGQLGEVPLQGHKRALQALAEQVPEADLSRVGIYGWSFGGYLSALAALKEPEFFKAAVSGAPPADWRDYDTAYTERYLGLPQTQEAAYEQASLLPWALQDKPSSPLLLVHGTADDNVYFLNGLKLADALVRAGKPFEFLPLVNVTHMLWEPTRFTATWSRAAAFFREHLAAPAVAAPSH